MRAHNGSRALLGSVGWAAIVTALIVGRGECQTLSPTARAGSEPNSISQFSAAVEKMVTRRPPWRSASVQVLATTYGAAKKGPAWT